MAACTECHAAKVKCDKVLPCSRCVSLSRVCVRHESRQGKGSNKRRRPAPQDDGLQPSEDAALSNEVTLSTLRSDHYGLQYLVRSWVSIAIRRRSLSLLSRAGAIATKCGITMDQILCETDEQRGMDFLCPILLTPATKQEVSGSPLRWSELPEGLLAATACCCDSNTNQDLDDQLGSRWIWVREMKRGISRYLVSPAFDRDICTLSLIQETWKANEQAVVDMFLSASERPKHTRGFAHQISLHTVQGTRPRSSRLSRIRLKTCSLSLVEVDQVSCVAILDLDHAFHYVEYIPREEEAPLSALLAAVEPPGQDLAPAQAVPAFEFDPPSLDLDTLFDDRELEFFLDLLK